MAFSKLIFPAVALVVAFPLVESPQAPAADPIVAVAEHLVSLHEGSWAFRPTIEPRRILAPDVEVESIPESVRSAVTKSTGFPWAMEDDIRSCATPTDCSLSVDHFAKFIKVDGRGSEKQTILVEVKSYDSERPRPFSGKIYEMVVRRNDAVWSVTSAKVVATT